MILMKTIEIPDAVDQIHSALGQDAKLYLVGGCIRDALMGEDPKDFDLATVLPPLEVMSRLDAAGIKHIPVGIRRGTISAIIKGEAYEITTFRCKGNETRFSSTIDEDLSARDFTINAIALNLRTEEIFDPFGGIKDIKAQNMKTVGDARERFIEDPHRIIRMCRFAAKFGFRVQIEQVAQAMSLKHTLRLIEPERICAELKKIFDGLDGDALRRCLLMLGDVGFYEAWIPEFQATRGVTQNKWHSLDVHDHILGVVTGCHHTHSKLAAFFHDIAKPITKTTEENGDVHFYRHEDVGAEMTSQIMKRLKFSNEDTATVTQLVRFHMRPIKCGNKAIRKLKVALGENFELWMDLKFADKFYGGTPDKELDQFALDWKAFEEQVEQVRVEELVHPTEKLALNGHEVMVFFGLNPGPVVGKLMDRAKDMVQEFPERNNYTDLIAFMAIEIGFIQQGE